MVFIFYRHEGRDGCLADQTGHSVTMRIHLKVVAIAVCFGVFLLVYFLGGNPADEPPLREVEEKDNSYFLPSSSGHGNIVAAKQAEKSHEEPRVIPKRPRLSRKEVKTSSRGGAGNAKTR